jgi:glutathione S-transferase
MIADNELFFYHSPNTRSTGVLTLLEELAAEYRLCALNMKQNEHRKPSFLSINPMGKVPAIKHGDAIITEQAALYLYLTDLYPDAGLAPEIGDSLRGPYLRWMVFYNSCFEPAIVDRAQKRIPAPRSISPYGDFDTMLTTLIEPLEKNDYLLGDKFSAVDVLWGTSLGWVTKFQLIPALPVFKNYIDRINCRPSIAWAHAKDVELLAKFA